MIETLYDLRAFTLPAHIGLGFGVLALFWAQIFSRKGSPFHILTGKIYYWAGLAVAGLAFYGVVTVLARALAGTSEISMNDPGLAALVFLGYLSVITAAVLEKGRSAIRFRGPSPGWRAVFAWLRGLAALFASVALIAYAAILRPENAILLFALSPLGIMIFAETISFQRKGNTPRSDRWVFEHLDGMFGSGIAFHTAFAVFGAKEIFDPLLANTSYQLLPWVLPTLIGLPATMLWKRRFMKASP